MAKTPLERPCEDDHEAERQGKMSICGNFLKPSAGLEPATPSLPWNFVSTQAGVFGRWCGLAGPAGTGLDRAGAPGTPLRTRDVPGIVPQGAAAWLALAPGAVGGDGVAACRGAELAVQRGDVVA